MRNILFASLLVLLLQGVSPVAAADHPNSFEGFLELSQPYITNVAAYNPLFFLVGTDLADSKFQISFKYRLFETSGDRSRWLAGVNFGYTQTSFWDLRDRSLPFKDTSYKPELYYHTANLAGDEGSWADGIFLKGGFRHESNGRDGDESRSTNTAYLETYLIFFNPERGYGIRIVPRIWAYIANDHDTNADLPDYRGYFQLHARMGWADGLILDSDLGWATQGGSYQFDLTYPLRTSLMRAYFHMEYVSVLAESLIDYRMRTEALRLGLSFVR